MCPWRDKILSGHYNSITWLTSTRIYTKPPSYDHYILSTLIIITLLTRFLLRRSRSQPELISTSSSLLPVHFLPTPIPLDTPLSVSFLASIDPIRSYRMEREINQHYLSVIPNHDRRHHFFHAASSVLQYGGGAFKTLSTSTNNTPIVIDSGASLSISPHRSDFHTFKPVKDAKYLESVARLQFQGSARFDGISTMIKESTRASKLLPIICRHVRFACLAPNSTSTSQSEVLSSWTARSVS